MRNRGILLGAALAWGLVALAGCDNTQGTAANPETLHETTAYTDGSDSQNTGAGAGTMMKPSPITGAMMGGDSPSQAKVKGTDSATGDFPSSLTGPGSGVTMPQHPMPPHARPRVGGAPGAPGMVAPPPAPPNPGVAPGGMPMPAPPAGAPGIEGALKGTGPAAPTP